MKKLNLRFLGPIIIYVREEDGYWLASVDPFSVFGEGETRDKALSHALNNLTGQFDVLAEETIRHQFDGIEVDMFCPLRAEYKENCEVHIFQIVAAYEAKEIGEIPRLAVEQEVPTLSASSLREVYSTNASVGIAEIVARA